LVPIATLRFVAVLLRFCEAVLLFSFISSF